jgi:hypothetical protein
MTRTKLVLNLGIVLRALIGVLDHQRDRRAGGDLAFVRVHHAGEDFDLIRFLPLGGVFALARAAAIKVQLNLFNRQRNVWGAAIDHAAERDPMAFAEGGDAKHVAEGVEGHRKILDGPMGPYSRKLT